MVEIPSSADSSSQKPPLPSLQELLGQDWCSVKQLSKILDVEYRTARRYVAEGRIKGIQVGGRWRVYETELRRFLTEGNAT